MFTTMPSPWETKVLSTIRKGPPYRWVMEDLTGPLDDHILASASESCGGNAFQVGRWDGLLRTYGTGLDGRV